MALIKKYEKNKKKKIIVCPRCKGEKKVIFFDDERGNYEDTCPLCYGSGLIKKIITIEYLKY